MSVYQVPKGNLDGGFFGGAASGGFYLRVPGQAPSYRWIDLGCQTFPWCDKLGGLAIFDERCRVFTEEEQIECQQADFGASFTPEMRQQAIDAGNESVEGWLAKHPDIAAEYAQGVALTGGDPELNSNIMMYLGLAAAAVGVLFIMSR